MALRTTVRLEEGLLEAAKSHAARQNRTLTSLIEEGVRLVLAKPVFAKRRKPVDLPVSACEGGVLPGVNLSNSAGLLDLLESDLPESELVEHQL